MQIFTIRDIENLTGIKAHTLRIWEQRYKFFSPKRKESQHRYYDNEDLKKLLRVAFLYHGGWKVSKIAGLSDQQLTSEVVNSDIGGDHKMIAVQLLEAAIDFDERRFSNIFQGIIKKMGFENAITQVCYPYLERVGLLWSTNNIIPAQEHFSSYIIQNKVIAETDALPLHKKERELILLAPSGEFHELPLLFINYLLRKRERNTVYLGGNVAVEELKAVMAEVDVRAIYIHLITNFTGLDLEAYMEQVCNSFPGKKIFASGGGMRSLQSKWKNLTVLHTKEQMEAFIGN